MHTRRLFVALPIEDEDIREELASVGEQVAKLLPNVEFSPEHQLHMTVTFIGDTDPDVARKLHDDLSAFALNTEAFTMLYLNQSQGGMCICRKSGTGLGISQEGFGP